MAEAFLAMGNLPNPATLLGRSGGGRTASLKRARGDASKPNGVDLSACVDLCFRFLHNTPFGAAVNAKNGLLFPAPVSFTSTKFDTTPEFAALLRSDWTEAMIQAQVWKDTVGFVPFTFKTVEDTGHRVPVVVQQGAFDYRMFTDSQGQPYILAFNRITSGMDSPVDPIAEVEAVQALLRSRMGGAGTDTGSAAGAPVDTSGLQKGMPSLGPSSVFSGLPNVARHVFVYISDVPTATGMPQSAAMRLVADWYFMEAARRHHMLRNATGCMPPIYTHYAQTPGVASQMGRAMIGGDSVAQRRTRQITRNQAGITGVSANTAEYHIRKVADGQALLGTIMQNVPITHDYSAPPIEPSRGTLASRIIPLPANQLATRVAPGTFHGNLNELHDNFLDNICINLGLPVQMLRPQAGRHSSEDSTKDMLRQRLRGERRRLETLMTTLFRAIYNRQMTQSTITEYMRRYNILTATVRRYISNINVRVLLRAAKNVQSVAKHAAGATGTASTAGPCLGDLDNEQPDETEAVRNLTQWLLHANGHSALGTALASTAFTTMMNSLVASPVLEDLSRSKTYQIDLLKLLSASMQRAAARTHPMARASLMRLPHLLTGADMSAPEVLVAVADGKHAHGKRRYNPKAGDAAAMPRPAAAAAKTHTRPTPDEDTPMENLAREEAEAALDADTIARYGNPMVGMPFQPDGFAKKIAPIRENLRTRLKAASESAAASGLKQGAADVSAVIQRIVAVMQEEMIAAFETAGKNSLGKFIDSVHEDVAASIHDTDPTQDICALHERGILTTESLYDRLAHQTGFNIAELEKTPPHQVIAMRNAETMKKLMDKYGVDASTALRLMGLQGGGAGGGAGAGTGAGTGAGAGAGTDAEAKKGVGITDQGSDSDDDSSRTKGQRGAGKAANGAQRKTRGAKRKRGGGSGAGIADKEGSDTEM